ncbi:MAG: GrpB family protein [bacterium]
MTKIQVVDYDPSWPRLFETENILLRQTLGGIVIEIHHIGSTAVPGLAAKPIIDILVEVTDLATLDARNGDMEAIGYNPKGEFGIPGRRYFQKGDDKRTHQIHAFVSGDFNVTRHIAFRDYLRSNPAVAVEYGELKKSVAKTCNNDIEKYCDGKDAYVKQHEAIAVKQKASNHAMHSPGTAG